MKIGIIGLGSIGLRHACNLLMMGHQVYGHDPDRSRCNLLRDAGGKLMANPYLHSFDTLGACDAVVIASPTPEHARGLECLRFGNNPKYKPAFVEKPIADRLDLENTDAVVMVGNNLRFHSAVIKAKEWLDAGMIGK